MTKRILIFLLVVGVSLCFFPRVSAQASTDSTEIWVGYFGDLYVKLADVSESEMEGLECGEWTYSALDNGWYTRYNLAYGVTMTSLLDYVGIDTSDINIIYFTGTDEYSGEKGNHGLYNLFGVDHYYYPYLAENWDQEHGEVTSPVVEGTYYKVPAILAFQQSLTRDSGAFDYDKYKAMMGPDKCLRIVFGQIKPTDVTAADSVYWVYRITVTLKGSPIISSNWDAKIGSSQALEDYYHIDSGYEALDELVRSRVQVSSDNPSVVQVDANGNLTAVGAGTARINIEVNGDDAGSFSGQIVATIAGDPNSEYDPGDLGGYTPETTPDDPDGGSSESTPEEPTDPGQEESTPDDPDKKFSDEDTPDSEGGLASETKPQEEDEGTQEETETKPEEEEETRFPTEQEESNPDQEDGGGGSGDQSGYGGDEPDGSHGNTEGSGSGGGVITPGSDPSPNTPSTGGGDSSESGSSGESGSAGESGSSDGGSSPDEAGSSDGGSSPDEAGSSDESDSSAEDDTVKRDDSGAADSAGISEEEAARIQDAIAAGEENVPLSDEGETVYDQVKDYMQEQIEDMENVPSSERITNLTEEVRERIEELIEQAEEEDRPVDMEEIIEMVEEYIDERVEEIEEEEEEAEAAATELSTEDKSEEEESKEDKSSNGVYLSVGNINGGNSGGGRSGGVTSSTDNMSTGNTSGGSGGKVLEVEPLPLYYTVLITVAVAAMFVGGGLYRSLRFRRETAER